MEEGNLVILSEAKEACPDAWLLASLRVTPNES